MADANGLAFARLGNVGELLMGNSPPGETYNDRGEGLPLINGPAEYGPRHPKPVKWTSAPGRVCKPGDILVCVRGNTTGRLCVADDEYCIGRGVAAIRGKDKTYLTPFLEFVLRYHQDEILEKATGGGSTFPNINKPQLEELEVPVPSLVEQQSIANVLRTVQGAKEATEEVVAAARQLKQSLMRHLFTYGPVPVNKADNLPQRETDYGAVPENWKTMPLHDCAVVQTGVAKGRKINGAESISVPYLRVANVQDGYLDLSEIKNIEIRRSELPRFSLEAGDVVLTEGGDFDKLGRGFIWNGEVPGCVHQNHIFAVRAKQGVMIPEFLAYLTQSAYGKAYFLSVAHKTTNLACINTTKLKALPALLPSMEEQREIVRTMRGVDRKIAVEEMKRNALDTLFRSLLHHLMTGKVRVNDPKTLETANAHRR